MIYGIGTDICDVQRVDKLYKKFGQRFAGKILSAEEKELLPVTGRAGWLAKRFAAKEAFAKALGTGFRDGLNLSDFGVLNNSKGAPEAFLTANAKQKLPTEAKVHISLSDEKGYAMAFVVIEHNFNQV